LTRAKGYSGQLAVQADRTLPHPATTHAVGIELGLKEFLLGLKEFLSTSDGATVANPRSLRQAERKRKRLPRQVSRNRARATGLAQTETVRESQEGAQTPGQRVSESPEAAPRLRRENGTGAAPGSGQACRRGCADTPSAQESSSGETDPRCCLGG